jgi:DNA-binding CsgD family transcriptional regulator
LDPLESVMGDERAVPSTGGVGVVSADFNRDGVADLAVITPGDELVVLLGAQEGSYRQSFRYRLDAQAQALHGADFDGDGTVDLAVAHAGERGLTFLYGKGDGTFRSAARVVKERSTAWTLTPREHHVARLASTGYTCREIAGILGVSRRTVETHIAAIRSKLELKHKRELVHGIKHSGS